MSSMNQHTTKTALVSRTSDGDRNNSKDSNKQAPSAHLGYEASRSQVVLAGAVAGMVSRFCIAPLDVMKIRLQLQNIPCNGGRLPRLSPSSSPPPPAGLLATFKSIIRTEGIRGFWKGNVPAEFLYITYGATQFTAFHAVARLFAALPPSSRPPRPFESFIGGATGGACATLATYPLDLLRTRFAAQGHNGQAHVYASLRASVRAIWRDEGGGGFFRGASAAVMQVMPYMGLFFACYEGAHQVLEKAAAAGKEKEGWGRRLLLKSGAQEGKEGSDEGNALVSAADALAGTAAGVAAKIGVFPLDTVRKRLQVQGPTRLGYGHGDIPEYVGVWRTLVKIVRDNGGRGLYRGLSVSLVKAAPASAMTMWTYETVLRAVT